MTHPTPLRDFVSSVLSHHESAVECFMALRDVLHFWDDLVDADQPVSSEDIHRAMFKALVTVPTNPFFRQYQDRLIPILVNAMANWHAANDFEAGNCEKSLQLAFVIRSDYANLLIQCAYLVGGMEWARRVTPLIRSYWTSEDYAAYRSNLSREQAARNGDSVGLVKAWYEEETGEYLRHGLTVFNAAMLGETEEEHVDRLIELIAPPVAPLVVDMGCGVGGVSRLMAAKLPGGRFYGVTNVQAQVEAMRELGGVEPVFCDYHAVPLLDGLADVVMFNESVGYGHAEQLLQESWRLLREGGILAIKDGVTLSGCSAASSTWQYAWHPQSHVEALARAVGFEVEVSHELPLDARRYADFLSKSRLMKSRYGQFSFSPSQTRCWFWRLRKPVLDHKATK